MTTRLTLPASALTLQFAALLLAALGVAWSAGHHWASPSELWSALTGADDAASDLLWYWRLPRVITAALVGALLGIGGCIFQGVFRNPLAEPYLLGTSGGAAVGASIALLVPLQISQVWSLPLLAFLGAWGATVLVLSVARIAGAIDAASLLLAGVAVAAMLAALRSFLMLTLSDENVSLQLVLSWTLGGIQTPSWQALGVLFVATVVCLGLSASLAGGLDRLGLGEEMAASFGLDVPRFVALAVAVGALIVATAVAYGGLVAFVGLAAPHIARWRVGPGHRRLLAASAVVGSVVVLVADAISRAALPPAEIPLGLITALAGAPFFILLLSRQLRAS
jgi:iron complex transport system permease protein